MAIKPIAKRKGQDYAVPNNAYRWNYHAGIDYPADIGTNIKAPAKGKFTFIDGDNGGYGRIAQVVDKWGFKHWISHTWKRQGANRSVKENEVIAKSGNSGWSTGPHAHWEVRWQNKDIDPELWIKVVRKYETYEKRIAELKKQVNNQAEQIKSLKLANAELTAKVDKLSDRPTEAEITKLKKANADISADLAKALKQAETARESFITETINKIKELLGWT